MTITSTAPTLTAEGITAPTYAEILDFIQQAYYTIFGPDVYLAPDSQDGQLIGIMAAAIHDANTTAIQVYNAFSPSTAAGTGLSSIVKQNGIARATPTNSTVTLRIVGTSGIQIVNGVAQDGDRIRWNLPGTVDIPLAGFIDVTATAAVAGATQAAIGTITTILTPQLGWQSVTNTDAAIAGAPIESDAALRARQSVSVAQPSQSPLVGVIGAVAAVPGVTRYTGYENPTGSVGSNSIPAHSIAIVAEGGDSTAIAEAIANHKTIGAGMAGTTLVVVQDLFGVYRTIKFYPVTEVRIVIAITVTPINGYTATIGASIQQALADYLNALAIGEKVRYTRLFQPANLNGATEGLTYEVTAMTIGIFGGGLAASDIVIGFTSAAHCDVADITLTVA